MYTYNVNNFWEIFSMKWDFYSLSISLFCPLILLLSVMENAEADETDVRALIRKVETQYQGNTSHAIVRMQIVTEFWSREIVMEIWSKGRDMFLARILSPKKDEGVASLKIGEEMWNYLPNIDRLVKIPSSMMGESWMGSNLTNDDLVKENQVDMLYNFSMEKEGEEVEITAIPKPEAPVVWGEVIYKKYN